MYKLRGRVSLKSAVVLYTSNWESLKRYLSQFKVLLWLELYVMYYLQIRSCLFRRRIEHLCHLMSQSLPEPGYSVVVIFWWLCSEIHIVFYLSIYCWSLCCVQSRIYLFITWVCYAIPSVWTVVINTLVNVTNFGTSPWSSAISCH